MVFCESTYCDAFFELRNGSEYDATKARMLKERLSEFLKPRAYPDNLTSDRLGVEGRPSPVLPLTSFVVVPTYGLLYL